MSTGDSPPPSEPAVPKPRGKPRVGRRAARLAAVQALYQMEITGVEADRVIFEFLSYRLEEDMEGLSLSQIDRAYFTDLVRGVTRERGELDDMILAVMSDDWTPERLALLLLTILRAGSYELGQHAEVPVKAVINEYVDLAHGFLTNREPAFVNGALDRIARYLRPDAFDDELPLDPLTLGG